MADINIAIISGRLTKQPEVKLYSGGSLAAFTIATGRRYRDKTGEWKEQSSFISCKAWGRTADIVAEYAKGTAVWIQGRIETGSYQKDGRTVYTTDINVDRISRISSAKPQQNPEQAVEIETLYTEPSKTQQTAPTNVPDAPAGMIEQFDLDFTMAADTEDPNIPF